MKTTFSLAALSAASVLTLGTFLGCESTGDGGSSHVSGSVYYGVGFGDPWYYGGYYNDPDIIVTPPINRPGPPPGRPDRPPPNLGARPTPLPSIPSRPMGGGGRGR